MLHTASDYYTNLLKEVIFDLERNGDTFVMVAGALGIGTETFKDNLKRMKDQMTLLASQGHAVFDQTPYLDIYHPEAPQDYAQKFDIFYKGIIQSGLIAKLFVLPGYEEARGVVSEIKYAKEKGIPITYL